MYSVGKTYIQDKSDLYWNHKNMISMNNYSQREQLNSDNNYNGTNKIGTGPFTSSSILKTEVWKGKRIEWGRKRRQQEEENGKNNTRSAQEDQHRSRERGKRKEKGRWRRRREKIKKKADRGEKNVGGVRRVWVQAWRRKWWWREWENRLCRLCFDISVYMTIYLECNHSTFVDTSIIMIEYVGGCRVTR